MYKFHAAQFYGTIYQTLRIYWKIIPRFSPFSLSTAPSSPPLDFVATPTDPRSIVLRWDPPLPEDRNGPITNYIVNVTVVETREMFEINTTSTTFLLDGLTPYTTYRFTIAASTEVGLGPFSETLTVQTPEDGMASCRVLTYM